MEVRKSFSPLLKQLLRLLKKEKKALIKNDGILLEKII
jgi:hypothetical protein